MNKHNKKTIDFILNRYANGEKISSISKSTGISRTTIYNWIKDFEHQQEAEAKPISLCEYNNLKRKCQRLTQMVEILKTTDCNTNTSLAEKCKIIKAMSDKYSISLLCETLGVAKGSYFNQTLRNKNGNTLTAHKRAEITPVIEEIFQESNQIFGAGKIKAILVEKGYTVSIKVVTDIMHQNGWFPIRSCAKTLYLQDQKRKKNILEQQFTTTRPNEIWVGDVTQFNFKEHKYYICVIIDLYARKVVGYKVSTRNSTQLTKSTFKEAYESRQINSSLIFHSDQGVNYTSKAFCRYLAELGVEQSFSRAGNPYENSVIESFFKNMKAEELYRTKYHSESELRQAIDKYIEFYNKERPHTYLQYWTPDKYEEQYYRNHATLDKTKINNVGSE